MPDMKAPSTDAVLAHPVVTYLKAELALTRALVWSMAIGIPRESLSRPERDALDEILGNT